MSEEEILRVLNYQLNMKDTDVYTYINWEALERNLEVIQ